MEQDFRVAVVGLEFVAERAEFGAEFGMVVDFAVESDAHIAVRAALCAGAPHRLHATADVHDAESPMPEMDAVPFPAPKPLRIRPTMGDAVGHAAQRIEVATPDETGYAAHGAIIFPPRCAWPARYRRFFPDSRKRCA